MTRRIAVGADEQKRTDAKPAAGYSGCRDTHINIEYVTTTAMTKIETLSQNSRRFQRIVGLSMWQTSPGAQFIRRGRTMANQ